MRHNSYLSKPEKREGLFSSSNEELNTELQKGRNKKTFLM